MSRRHDDLITWPCQVQTPEHHLVAHTHTNLLFPSALCDVCDLFSPRCCSSTSEPEVELFQMAASIPGRSRAVFLLTYEELLQRRLGRYEHVSSLRPMQLVSRLRLEVALSDRSPITQLKVLPLRNAKSSSSSSTSRTQGQ